MNGLLGSALFLTQTLHCTCICTYQVSLCMSRQYTYKFMLYTVCISAWQANSEPLQLLNWMCLISVKVKKVVVYVRTYSTHVSMPIRPHFNQQQLYRVCRFVVQLCSIRTCLCFPCLCCSSSIIIEIECDCNYVHKWCVCVCNVTLQCI